MTKYNNRSHSLFLAGLLGVFVFTFLIATPVAPVLAQSVSNNNNVRAESRFQNLWELLSRWMWWRNNASPIAVVADDNIKMDDSKRACLLFVRNLGVGARGREVADLHEALARSGFAVTASAEINANANFRTEDPGGHLFGEATAAAVVQFQAKHGILQTGFVGPLTRAKLQELYPCVVDNNNTRPPVIQSVSGPNNLNVGATGTWTVRAAAPATSVLTYSVDWGDSSAAANIARSNDSEARVSQTATFTHVYNRAGTYTATFIVADQAGRSDRTQLSIRVGANLPNPTLQVLAPAGGESWPIGSSQTISWQITGEIPAGSVLQLNLLGSTNVNLKRFAAGEFTHNGSWTITVPDRGCWGDMCDIVRPGEYLVEVALFDRVPCYDGCLPNATAQVLAKSSSGPIRVLVANQPNQPPVVSAVSGPTVLALGTVGTWTVSASDAENGPLTYSVDWGDGSAPSSTALSARSAIFTQNAVFTHIYTRSGTYTPMFSVTDNAGLTARTSLSVEVR